jgi:transcriptional regulator with XRE-family HTH domain
MKLKEIRFNKSISQWKLSYLCGVPQSRISLIEQGFPSRLQVKDKIAKALGVKTREIEWTEMKREHSEHLDRASTS